MMSSHRKRSPTVQQQPVMTDSPNSIILDGYNLQDRRLPPRSQRPVRLPTKREEEIEPNCVSRTMKSEQWRSHEPKGYNAKHSCGTSVMKSRAIIWLTLVAAVSHASADDLSSLIDQVFGPSTPTPVNPGSNPDYIPGEKDVPPQPIPTRSPGPRYPEVVQPIDEPQEPHQPDDGLGGDACECVPYYLCANDSIITDGTGLLDIRRPTGDPCQTSVDVCCGKKLKPNEPPITPRPKGRSSCGTRNTDGVGFRITGNVNNEAQFGEFPWMVAILKTEDINGEKLSVYKCGGALIHENVVMTAAHCVAKDRPHDLKARAGEWDTQTAQELFPHQDRHVAQVIIHENYYAGALFNDIALLIMEEPFVFADNIDVVCLPQSDDVVLDKSCWASGWGKDVFGKQGQYQVILKRVELPMVPRDKCQDSFRHTRLGPKFRLHESFVCAGGIKGQDTCKGDGGSPLICPIPGKPYQYQQVGMVAWGIGCGNETPAAYVNVAKFRNWVDHHLQRLGFRPEYDYNSGGHYN